MSSLFGIGANGAASFYNGVATQSLRFDDGSSAYLTRTPSGAGNRKTWTWSGWIKLGVVTIDRTLFGAGTNGDNQTFINVSDTDKLVFNNEISNSRFIIQSDAVYRDPSAWYHVVLAVDTTQSTNTNRVKIYVNGELQTLSSVLNGYPNQDVDTFVNATNAHEIGSSSWGPAYYNDGYMAEVNFVDGLALDASYFGETKNGIWIAKNPVVSEYGTNGFRLQFNQTGVGTASTTTIGADTSGKTNHLTSSGIVAHDCNMPDSPENNFMTFNPLMRQSQGSDFPQTHEGNLQAHFAGSDQYKYIWSTFDIKPNTGKWYFEVEMQTNMGSTNDIAYIGLGTVGPNFTPTGSNGTVGPTNFYITWRGNTGVRTLYINDAGQSQTTVTVTNMTAGQIWQFAIDTDTGKVWLGLDNSYYAADGGTDGNPSAGTNESGTFSTNTNELSFFGQAQNYNITNVYYTLNAGQDSSFHGNKTAQGNTDANGIGDFYYAPPTGYKALCTANLPESTIGPNSATQADDYFNTVLYTGNATARSITGVGFQPDWVWSKARGLTQSHRLVDSTRGVQKSLYSNSTDTEGTESGLTAFNADGFSIGTETSFNYNTEPFVAWNWKANGGVATASGSESGNTLAYSAQANTTSGFSIVTYTGNGANNADVTINHGLGVTPDWVIIKNRTNGNRWHVWHKDLSADGTYTTKNILLNTSAGEDAYSDQIKSVSSSAVIVRSDDSNGNANVNKDSSNYVMYCFHSVEGYSRFGSYTGNGNNDGTYVFTGFRPAWVLIKKSGSGTASHWRLTDTTRSPFNVTDAALSPSSNAAEFSENDMDILSNGFKLRQSNTYVSQSGVSFIYMAFAEAPFKYANAR